MLLRRGLIDFVDVIIKSLGSKGRELRELSLLLSSFGPGSNLGGTFFLLLALDGMLPEVLDGIGHAAAITYLSISMDSGASIKVLRPFLAHPHVLHHVCASLWLPTKHA